MVRCRGTTRRVDDRIDVTNEAKKSPSQRRGAGAGGPPRPSSRPPPVAPLHDELLDETPAAPLALAEPAEPEPAAPLLDDLALATPEVAFAARAAARPPEPERPWPDLAPRDLLRRREHQPHAAHRPGHRSTSALDRVGTRTDFVAVGNWRVIGHDTARLLARHGAQLLHSAPAVGVKDWSDLRIAVAAGVWLGTARPGDILEIVSDDRAFDAVGDVATSLGISFRRLSYRGLTGLPRECRALAGTRRRASRASGVRRSARRSVPSRRRGGRAALRSSGVAADGARRRRLPPSRRRAAHRAARRAAGRGARPHLGVTRPHGHARHAGQRAQGARLQPAARLAAAHHAPAPDPRAAVSRAGHITLVDSATRPRRATPAEATIASRPSRSTRPRRPSVRLPMRPPPTPGTRARYEERRAEVEAALRGEIVPRDSEPAAVSDAPAAEDASLRGRLPRTRSAAPRRLAGAVRAAAVAVIVATAPPPPASSPRAAAAHLKRQPSSACGSVGTMRSGRS